MEVLKVIDMLEEVVDKAPSVPFTGKIMLDKDDIIDYIQELRLVYPEELKEAKWIKEERERIISEAESKAEAMQKNAEERILQLIDEHEITKQAYEKANELVTNAQREARAEREECSKYANDILGDVERRLEKLIDKVREDKSYYNRS